MVLIIDNYDSYTYNLVQYVGILGYEPIVFRNDQLSCQDIKILSPSHIIISPGPKDPTHSGISLEAIASFHKTIPILGVCLGHQAIGHFFGLTITRATEPMHGKVSKVFHNGQSLLFKNIPSPFNATRYHSLLINSINNSSPLQVTATTQAGEIMALQHKTLPIYGVQFHPESFATEDGLQMIQNFLILSPTPEYALP